MQRILGCRRTQMRRNRQMTTGNITDRRWEKSRTKVGVSSCGVYVLQLIGEKESILFWMQVAETVELLSGGWDSSRVNALMHDVWGRTSVPGRAVSKLSINYLIMVWLRDARVPLKLRGTSSVAHR